MLLSLREIGRGTLSSAPTLFSFFYVTGRLGIIAKTFERMRSLFFSTLLLASPLSNRKVSYRQHRFDRASYGTMFPGD